MIPCGLVLRSVGYRGVALPGVPFDDDRGVIPNADGRVLDAGGEPIAGLYCAGWIKRGPSGVIGTNKKDAAETVEHVLEDAEAGLLARGRGRPRRAARRARPRRSSTTRAGRRSTATSRASAPRTAVRA